MPNKCLIPSRLPLLRSRKWSHHLGHQSQDGEQWHGRGQKSLSVHSSLCLSGEQIFNRICVVNWQYQGYSCGYHNSSVDGQRSSQNVPDERSLQDISQDRQNFRFSLHCQKIMQSCWQPRTMLRGLQKKWWQRPAVSQQNNGNKRVALR